jgi:tRNA threonylcarbamoyl adenosine modification protein (Sua5/YciO/YrdC/YwlC family)
MLIRIYPDNPAEKPVAQAVKLLENDGVIIYPTDSLYAFGCSIKSLRAIERLKAVSEKKGSELSIICSDLSQAAKYARIDNGVFKILKRNLPGPFTFILNASAKVPDKYLERRKSVGIRITGNAITQAIAEALGYPLVTTSVKELNDETEYITDPSLIDERYGNAVDAVIDGGYGHLEPTTVVDLTGDEPAILRRGQGELK